MRDQEIFVRLSELKANIGNLYRQFTFIDTRLQAMEAICFQKNSWYHFLMHPKQMFKRINDLHLALMQKHDEELRKANQEKKIIKPSVLVGTNGKR